VIHKSSRMVFVYHRLVKPSPAASTFVA